MSAAGAAMFADGKDAGALRTIGEVSKALGIAPHILRYWEQQFPMLEPLKRSGGRRYYRAEDIALVQSIDRLVNHEGYTLRGAVKALKAGKANEPAPPVVDEQPVADTGSGSITISAVDSRTQASGVDAAMQLRAIRDRLASAL